MQEFPYSITEQTFPYSITEQECNGSDVRLVSDSSPNKGRVEFCYNGLWGIVCADPWDSNDTLVVCRQLGYSTGCKFSDHNL